MIYRLFLPLARVISPLFPKLEYEMKLAGVEEDAMVYLAKALAFSLFLALVFALVFYFVSPLLSMVFFTVVFLFSLIQRVKRPRTILQMKKRSLEENLLNAMRHIMVQVQAGVPVSMALSGVTKYDYGEATEYFREIQRRISSGESLTSALEAVAEVSPSPFFSRFLRILSSSVSTGVSPVEPMQEVINDFVEYQRAEMERYSRELNPWMLMYMMLTVIFPAMGISLLVISSSLTPIPFSTSSLFALLFFIFSFHFFFLKLIKMRRPKVVV